MMGSRAAATMAAALFVASAAAQDIPLRPFLGEDVEVRRAEPVRRGEPVPRAEPVRRPEAAPTPVPIPPRAAATPRPAAPAKPTPVPQPDIGDPTGEIRVSPTNTPMSPDQVQLSIADSFYSRGMFEMAAPEYEKYLGLYPGGPDKQTVLYRLGESYRRNNTFNAARSSYHALLDQFSNGDFVGPASYRLGEIYFQEKNYTSALPHFRRASVRLKEPKLANAAKFLIARCHEAMGDKREARIVYEDLVATPKDNPFLDNSRLSYALLLKEEGRTDPALKQMQALANTTTNPELKAQATVYSGLWLIDLGQLQKAEAALKSALEMESVGRWRDLAQFGLIQLAFAAERYQEVLDTWANSGKDFGPEARPQVMLLAAKAARALKKTEQSLELFSQVAKEYGDTGYAKEAAYERLVLLYRADDPSLLQEIDKYLESSPEDQKRDQAQLMKAEMLYKKQDFSGAAPLYEALGNSRQLTGLMKAEALFKLGWCYLQTRENDRAVKAYTQLIDGFPTFKSLPAALLQRAVALIRLDNLEGATKDLRTLADKHPKAKEREAALLQLGRLLGQRGDNSGMMEMFKVYLRDYPNASGPEAAEANFWLGSAAFENKAYKDAIAPLKKAIEGNKEEYFERASLRLMLCHYYLEDKEGCGREIDAYLAGSPKGQVPYEVLNWIGRSYHEEGRKAKEAGDLPLALEKHKSALKYLGMLVQRDDVKPVDQQAFGRSGIAVGEYAKAEAAFQSMLRAVKEPLARATGLNDLAQAQIGLKKFPEAQKALDEALKLQPDGPVNAKLRESAGDLLAAQQQWLEAAKAYASVTVIIDDEELTPRAGEKAVEAYRNAGLEDEASKLLNKLQSRYPEFFQNKRANP